MGLGQPGHPGHVCPGQMGHIQFIKYLGLKQILLGSHALMMLMN